MKKCLYNKEKTKISLSTEWFIYNAICVFKPIRIHDYLQSDLCMNYSDNDFDKF